MPLVRISLLEGKPADFGEKVGGIVYESMVESADGILFIQITLTEGRGVELKESLYKRVAERLGAELGVRGADVFINLVEMKKENWSFGKGVAQYVT